MDLLLFLNLLWWVFDLLNAFYYGYVTFDLFLQSIIVCVNDPALSVLSWNFHLFGILLELKFFNIEPVHVPVLVSSPF